jgi:hypothetical protein
LLGKFTCSSPNTDCTKYNFTWPYARILKLPSSSTNATPPATTNEASCSAAASRSARTTGLATGLATGLSLVATTCLFLALWLIERRRRKKLLQPVVQNGVQGRKGSVELTSLLARPGSTPTAARGPAAALVNEADSSAREVPELAASAPRPAVLG